MQQPRDIGDIRQLAGLLEGEGCFDYSGHTARIRLGMTDLDVVMHASDILGTATRIHRKIRGGNRKDAFTLYVHGNAAAAWMMTLYAHLGGRRRARIREVLRAWREQPGRGRRPAASANGAGMLPASSVQPA